MPDGRKLPSMSPAQPLFKKCAQETNAVTRQGRSVETISTPQSQMQSPRELEHVAQIGTPQLHITIFSMARKHDAQGELASMHVSYLQCRQHNHFSKNAFRRRMRSHVKDGPRRPFPHLSRRRTSHRELEHVAQGGSPQLHITVFIIIARKHQTPKENLPRCT